MAPGGERPDLDALKELGEVLAHLEGELASWRRRALSAESRLGEGGTAGGDPAPKGREIEEENRVLQQRLAGAKARLADLLERLRFLEQQHDHRENGS